MSLIEKITEQLPAGTRPQRWAIQQIDNSMIEGAAVDVVEFAKRDMARELPEPRRFVVMDASEIDPVQDGNLISLPPGPSLPVTIVFGFTLGAIPGKLPHVVVQGSGSHMDGRWYSRSEFSAYPLIVKNGADRSVVAESRGRIEIRDDGALAEVYEVGA